MQRHAGQAQAVETLLSGRLTAEPWGPASVDPHDVVAGALAAVLVDSVATTGGVTGKPRVQDAKADAVDGASSSVLASTVIVQGLDERVFGH